MSTAMTVLAPYYSPHLLDERHHPVAVGRGGGTREAKGAGEESESPLERSSRGRGRLEVEQVGREDL